MRNNSSILASLQGLFGDDFNLSLLVSIIKKSLVWILLLFLLASLFVVVYIRYTPPIYEATSSLMLQSDKKGKLLGYSDVLKDDKDEILREVQLISSRFIVERVLQRLPLQVSYFKEGRTKLVSSELYISSPFFLEIDSIVDQRIYDAIEIEMKLISRQRFQISYSVADQQYVETYLFKESMKNDFFHGRMYLSLDGYNNFDRVLQDNYFFVINNLDRYVDRVMTRLSVIPLNPNTKTIEIKFQDNSKTKIRDMVSALADEFIQYDIERKTESARSSIRALNNQIDTLEMQLKLFQDTIKRFTIKYNLLNPAEESRNLSGKINSLKDARNELLLSESMVNWFYDYAERLRDLRAISSGLVDREIGDYNSHIAELRKLEDEKKELLLDVAPTHYKVKTLDEEIARVRSDLFTDLDNNQRKIDFKKLNIKNQLDTLQIRYRLLPEIEAEYNSLMRKYTIQENRYLYLLDRLVELAIAKTGAVSDYVILKKASIPSSPLSPNETLLWTISLSLAFALGIIIIVLRYLLHDTIISVDDITKRTKAPVLGVVPTVYSQIPLSTIVVSNNPKSVVSESLRTLRSNLQFIESNDGPKTLAMTSTISGEGKTFVAINLGAILSFLGKRVVILDLDMRRPRLSKVFEVSNEKGMSTVLIGKDNVYDCMFKTELENLDFVTSGPIPPNPAELILSSKMDAIVDELKNTYEYVIFDTPPLGLVTDGLEIIKNVNYPIYIFRADYSSRSFINNLDKLIDENGIRNLSVVLNDVGRGVSGYYYGYGYGGYGYAYGYGYGFGYYSDETKPQKSFLKRIFNRE